MSTCLEFDDLPGESFVKLAPICSCRLLPRPSSKVPSNLDRRLAWNAGDALYCHPSRIPIRGNSNVRLEFEGSWNLPTRTLIEFDPSIARCFSFSLRSWEANSNG